MAPSLSVTPGLNTSTVPGPQRKNTYRCAFRSSTSNPQHALIEPLGDAKVAGGQSRFQNKLRRGQQDGGWRNERVAVPGCKMGVWEY